ncbi:hypothetical protein D1AOALGA4SA_4366 [Olavius algarvensis Delta 1 endosymbiont]|nr:hypothetical protein D1AOALGA4SA_4366 [Olavius algarvensis Delta 1 endosymbiont]
MFEINDECRLTNVEWWNRFAQSILNYGCTKTPFTDVLGFALCN